MRTDFALSGENSSRVMGKFPALPEAPSCPKRAKPRSPVVFVGAADYTANAVRSRERHHAAQIRVFVRRCRVKKTG